MFTYSSNVFKHQFKRFKCSTEEENDRTMGFEALSFLFECSCTEHSKFLNKEYQILSYSREFSTRL
ncbi:hypothetical protein Pint_09097 [Pistacia integerrima]|uniref:Uncharacterized protein n=1 Tax=Pistacia integerrima TaxID=434235 RepID=A0ACC0XTB1_9ROSI|nr:hypothetical protein Pint_09097 [Pistacia integerrima]